MIVEGWASTADRDHYGHVVEPGAFTASIASRGLNGPRGVKLLAFHDTSKPLGRIIELQQRNSGLWIKADINEDLSYGKDVATATKAAGGLNFSVGFFPKDSEWRKDAQGRLTYYISRGELMEVSVVTEPGNANAVMLVEKHAPGSMEAILASLAKTAATLASLQSGAERKQQPIPSNLLDTIQKMKEALK